MFCLEHGFLLSFTVCDQLTADSEQRQPTPLRAGFTYGWHNDKITFEREREQAMFGMKSKKEKLEAKLKNLLQEAYELSHTNRAKSDAKTAEAEELRKQIDAMD